MRVAEDALGFDASLTDGEAFGWTLSDPLDGVNLRVVEVGAGGVATLGCGGKTEEFFGTIEAADAPRTETSTVQGFLSACRCSLNTDDSSITVSSILGISLG